MRKKKLFYSLLFLPVLANSVSILTRMIDPSRCNLTSTFLFLFDFLYFMEIHCFVFLLFPFHALQWNIFKLIAIFREKFISQLKNIIFWLSILVLRMLFWDYHPLGSYFPDKNKPIFYAFKFWEGGQLNRM
jgi:hypothetical protein